MQESLLRQVFADDLRLDEVQVALCEVCLVHPGSEGRAVPAWAAVTDGGLLARVALGAGVHQTLRIDHAQVKSVDASGSDRIALQVTYFNPRRAVDEVWRLHLEPSVAAGGFSAALAHAVSKHQAQATLVEAAAAVVAAEWAVADSREADRPASVA